MDHENYSPGSQITLKIECTVRPNENITPHIHFHTFNVNILDQNDNGPMAQEPHGTYEIKVEHPHFRKVSQQKKTYINFFTVTIGNRICCVLCQIY